MIRRAGGARGRLAAPAPHPTSSTVPAAGSARRAAWWVGVRRAPSADAAAAANTDGLNPHGDSGATARIWSGTAQAARASDQRDAALMTAAAPVERARR